MLFPLHRIYQNHEEMVGIRNLTKFENDFKEVFPDIFEPYKNRYDDRFCKDADSFENV
jgi:hypothetical protein